LDGTIKKLYNYINKENILGGKVFMDITEAIESRFTCRAFKPDPVKTETILKIMEQAIRSPSWANTQPWEIFVAGGDVLERIRRSYMDYFSKDEPANPDIPWVEKWPAPHEERIKELGIKRYQHLGISKDNKTERNASWRLNFKFFDAPSVIYLCMHESLSEWSMFDLGSISQSIMLIARSYGLDTAPAVNLVVYPQIIRDEMKIPNNLSIVFGIAIGYKDSQSIQNSFRSPRRSLDEVVRLKGF
jgi:nitroreductase